MSHPAPSHAAPIPRVATRSPCTAHNTLRSDVLGLSSGHATLTPNVPTHTCTPGAQAAADFFLARPPLQGYAAPGREQAMRSLPIASRRSSAERRRRRWRTALGRVVRPLRQSRRATGRQGQARHCTPTPIFPFAGITRAEPLIRHGCHSTLLTMRRRVAAKQAWSQERMSRHGGNR